MNIDMLELVNFIIVLLFSVILHEVAHGLMAYKLGDPTAKYEGRLTLNPIPHIDLFGSIILPGVLYILNLPILGAAKPVPVNYNNLSNIRRDMFLVAIVGPLTNLALALVAGLVYRLFGSEMSSVGEGLMLQAIQLNLVLAVFNMIPVPPLDGSKVLASILGYADQNLMYRYLDLERYGFILVFVLIMIPGLLGTILLPPVVALMELFTGQNFVF